MRRRVKPDQPQRAHRAAPLVYHHDHQRQQEHGAPDDRHDGDREMEAFDDDERGGALVRGVGRSRRQRRQPCGDVAGERARVCRIVERDVDPRDRLRARDIRRIGGERQHVRQVQARLEAWLREAHRIRRGLVDAGNPERPRIRSRRIGRQPDDGADVEAAAFGELSGDQNRRWVPGWQLRGGGDGGGDERGHEEDPDQARHRSSIYCREGSDTLGTKRDGSRITMPQRRVGVRG